MSDETYALAAKYQSLPGERPEVFTIVDARHGEDRCIAPTAAGDRTICAESRWMTTGDLIEMKSPK